MSVWMALGFIFLGMGIAEYYNYRAWARYKDGRKDEEKSGQKFC